MRVILVVFFVATCLALAVAQPPHLDCIGFWSAITTCAEDSINILQHYTTWCDNCCYSLAGEDTGYLTTPFSSVPGMFAADWTSYNGLMLTAQKDPHTRSILIAFGGGGNSRTYAVNPELSYPAALNKYSDVYDNKYMQYNTLYHGPDGGEAYTASGLKNPDGTTNTHPEYFGALGSIAVFAPNEGKGQIAAENPNYAHGGPPGTVASSVNHTFGDPDTFGMEIDGVTWHNPFGVTWHNPYGSDDAGGPGKRYQEANCKTWWSNRSPSGNNQCFIDYIAMFTDGYAYNFTNLHTGYPNGNDQNCVIPTDYPVPVLSFPTIRSAGGASWTLDKCPNNEIWCGCCIQSTAFPIFAGWSFVAGVGQGIDTTSAFSDSGSGA